MAHIVGRTWSEFWGKLLLIEVHRGNPDRWSSRERKAEWVQRRLGDPAHASILDLGCGDGLLDICLARLGHSVVAVDRIGPVLDEARRTDDTERVDFRELDLRAAEFPPSSFDAVLLFEVLGLMSRADDTRLIQAATSWLRPGGKLLVDLPLEPRQREATYRQEVPGGTLTIRAAYDASTRMQHLEPRLDRSSDVVVLRDAYDPDGGSMDGVLRYLYPRGELRELIDRAGLVATEVDHFSPEGWSMHIGERPTVPE